MALNAISNPAVIALQAYMGSIESTNNLAINYLSSSTLTSVTVDSNVQEIPANTTTNAPVAVNLSPIFGNDASPVFFVVYDITSPGQTFYVGTGAGAQMVEVSAGGFWAFAAGGSLPTTIYLANPNGTVGSVKLVAMSN